MEFTFASNAKDSTIGTHGEGNLDATRGERMAVILSEAKHLTLRDSSVAFGELRMTGGNGNIPFDRTYLRLQVFVVDAANHGPRQ